MRGHRECQILSLIHIFAMGLNAFAAPSPAAGGAVKNEAVAAVDKNGNKITVGINDNVNADVVADVKKADTLKAVLGDEMCIRDRY